MREICKTAVLDHVQKVNSTAAVMVDQTLLADEEIRQMRALGVELETPKSYDYSEESQKLIQLFQKKKLKKEDGPIPTVLETEKDV